MRRCGDQAPARTAASVGGEDVSVSLTFGVPAAVVVELALGTRASHVVLPSHITSRLQIVASFGTMAMAMATATTTPAPKSSARNLSSLFSWNKSRQVTPLNCFLEMDVSSPRMSDMGSPTELSALEDSHLSYTSLRDLLPTSRPGSPVKPKRAPEVGSPPPEEDDAAKMWSGCDRPPIKNRLVEQAARAYLLPTSSQATPPDQFFARYWARLTCGSGPSEAVLVPGATGCVHGCTHGCLSCLHTLLWVDLTRAVHALLGHLKPPSMLREHAHGSTVVKSSAPSLK